MSFSLKPTDGSARLLGPSQQQQQPSLRSWGGSSGSQDPAPSAMSASDGTDKVQAAIQAVLRFAADVRRQSTVLSTAHSRTTSAEHVKQVAGVARETISQAKRWLQELSAGAQGGGPPSDQQKLLLLKHAKLSENLARAASELEQSWTEFAAADAAWVKRQAQEATLAQERGEQQQKEDEEAGDEAADVERGAVQLQESGLVTQAEVELHAALADEYAREVRELSQNMHGLQRAMVDLAEQTRMQGETLNGIEENMDKACDKTSDALDQLQVTEERQRRNLRFTLCLLLTVCGVSAGILAMVQQ